MKLDKKKTILVGIAFLTISAFWQLYDFVVPLMLRQEFGISDTISGIVMSLDNVLALFLLPFFGALSDRSLSRFGKRMPYIFVGTLFVSVGMFLLPLAAKIKNLPLLVVSLGIVLIFMSVYRSPSVALMPDITIKPLRSEGNAVINLMGAIGGVFTLVGLSLFDPLKVGYYPIFILVAGLMLLGLAIMIVTVKENQWAQQMLDDMRHFNIVEIEDDPNTNSLPKEVKRSLWFILASISFWYMGYNAVTTAFSRYATLQIGLTGREASFVLLFANVGAIVSFIPIGIFSSKFGRKFTIRAGVCLLGLVFLTATFYHQFSPLIYLNFVLAGVAWAAINVNSLPMVLEMADSNEVGKFTGLYYTFSMAAQIVTPIFSGLLFDVFSYRVLFPYATFFVVLSFITMSQVKHGDVVLEKE
ncbi:MFS transporter [Vagococcus silagei]|uniref:MFS transporter n=1 Tax=Vagococcus silagei TaxID=2508885 RepID=A0A4S3B6I3_9ENTE|nr:MFS transporter [Vagococcus silagei]THB61166.1 MFS transporter [Vagococcus silagei]